MVSSSATAPPPDSSSSPGNSNSSSSGASPASSSSSAPPPPDSSSSSPPPTSSPPPDSSPSPPPPPSPTPPSDSSPPPSSESSSSSSPPPPPPPDSSSSSSPPPPSSSGSSSSVHAPPPPPWHSSSSSGSSPPPPKALSPPLSSSSSSSSSTTSASDNLSLLVGVSAGLGLLLIAFIAICVACSTRKKKKRRDDMHYFMDPSHKVADYYNSAQHANWHNGAPMPPPGMMGSPNGAGWPVPPPPPPMMSSGEMSGSYSGPHPHSPLPPPSPGIALGINSSSFTYDELAAATGGFSQANVLGQGGFGYVHKGVLKGKEVAVKSLKSGSGQGEREFQAEVDIISRVHHRHLVSLVGYCIAGGQRMLVYEFVPNKTLEYHLHGQGCPVMDWASRIRIAIGSAKGLAYLHEDCHPRIIHRDIKAANILLDKNFEAMVADFGLAKLSSDNYTHVSTRVMGTFGYLAPEYASSGKLTEKSDVFSFGVMLLELITGKRPVDINNVMEDSLVDWARPLLSQGVDGENFDELVDPRLEGNYNPREISRMVACAGAAIRHSAKKRPKMSQIVRALEGDVSLDDLNEGVRPGQSSVFTSSSSEYDTAAYNADMAKFRKMALASQDFASSEYGGGGSSGDSKEMGRRSPNYAY